MRLRAMFVDALARLADRLEERREYREAMTVMRRLIAADPLDERSYRGLIRLAAAAGDRSAGLHAYHACSTVLNDELGVAPSRETQAAYAALLAGDRAEQAPVRSSESPPQNRLVGRAEPWAALEAAVEDARTGRTTMALLTGEPGIGKSRLSEELVRWARSRGSPRPTVAATRRRAGSSMRHRRRGCAPSRSWATFVSWTPRG